MRISAAKPIPADDGFQLALGINYIDFLALFHHLAEPASYLEVGTSAGDSLKVARCASVAIDPAFHLTSNVTGKKPALHLFHQTSDEAFANPRLKALDLAFDMAFLDGLHLFEFLLRDFINTEKLIAEGGAIFLHDTAPYTHEMAERRAGDGCKAWTGDVWKLLPILAKFRPELSITHLDCEPTGLALITGPWNSNPALEDQYAAITGEWQTKTLETFGTARYYAGFPLIDCDLLLGGMTASRITN